MDAKELRIGNIVAHDDHSGYYFKVAGIEKDIQEGEIVYVVKTEGGSKGVWDNPVDLVSPIPLTESILYKCGFQKSEEHDNEYYIKTGERDSFIITYGPRFEDNGFSSIAYLMANLPNEEHRDVLTNSRYVIKQYLHELQNLFYAVIGRELEVNLPICQEE